MTTERQYQALKKRIEQWAQEAKEDVDASPTDIERSYRRGQMDVALYLLAFVDGMENPGSPSAGITPRREVVVGKTLDDDENAKLSDEELLAKLNKSIEDADKWNEENPDPQR